MRRVRKEKCQEAGIYLLRETEEPLNSVTPCYATANRVFLTGQRSPKFHHPTSFCT